ncbi:MAG: TonB-dependent receptor, partial [Steroidobacteraceae bacterium]
QGAGIVAECGQLVRWRDDGRAVLGALARPRRMNLSAWQQLRIVQRNIGRQRNRGIELSGEYQPIETLRLAGVIDLLDRDNLSSPNIRPTNTPRRRYRAVADWQFATEW